MQCSPCGQKSVALGCWRTSLTWKVWMCSKLYVIYTSFHMACYHFIDTFFHIQLINILLANIWTRTRNSCLFSCTFLKKWQFLQVDNILLAFHYFVTRNVFISLIFWRETPLCNVHMHTLTAEDWQTIVVLGSLFGLRLTCDKLMHSLASTWKGKYSAILWIKCGLFNVIWKC